MALQPTHQVQKHSERDFFVQILLFQFLFFQCFNKLFPMVNQNFSVSFLNLFKKKMLNQLAYSLHKQVSERI